MTDGSPVRVTSIAIVNAIYPPEPVVSAHIGADLANYLLGRGARVTVLCPFPTRPHGVRYAGFEPAKLPRVDHENGVQVVRLPSFTAPKSRLWPRMWESLSFGWHACRYLERYLPNVDVVYANAWPLFSQALLARYCGRRRIPMVLHIQDVYPEALLEKLPRPARRAAASPLTALDRSTAQHASRVVVISPNMRRTYLQGRGVPADKVVMIFDWQDESRFADLPGRAEVCARYEVPADPFTFLYLGNIGPVAGVEGLIRAFARASLHNSQLLIIGDGSNKKRCKALAGELGVRAVRFLSCPTPADAPVLQQMAHICLLPVRRGAGMSSIPSKLTAYLLSAKPVLATVDCDSDTAQCIREAQCGWIGEPENGAWLSQKMADVAVLKPAALDGIGARGRSYALKHFSKANGVRRLADVIFAAQRPARLPHGGLPD